MGLTQKLGTIPLAIQTDSSNNVGIGTATPNSYANLRALTINGTNGSVLDFTTNGTLFGELYSLTNELRIDAVGASSRLGFFTNSIERMRITSSGNVGIGTSNPGSAFPNGQGWTYTTQRRVLEIVSTSTDANSGLFLRRPDNATGLDLWADNYWGDIYMDNRYPGIIVFRNNTASSAAEKMRINPNGYLKVSNNGTYYSSGGSYHEIHQSASNNSCLRVFATSTSYDDAVQQINCYRTNSSAYSLASFYSNNFADQEFNFRGDGQAYADGSWNGGGADYAEYFEWLDGNPNNEDRRGYSVSLVGNKIKIAEKGETIIGVISGNPSVVGDSAWNIWTEKYLRDDFGTYVRDENGDRILNPNYNPDIDYIPREQRPEWGIVGLMGKLCIRKGQEVMPNWVKMKDVSDLVEQWLIK